MTWLVTVSHCQGGFRCPANACPCPCEAAPLASCPHPPPSTVGTGVVIAACLPRSQGHAKPGRCRATETRQRLRRPRAPPAGPQPALASFLAPGPRGARWQPSPYRDPAFDFETPPLACFSRKIAGRVGRPNFWTSLRPGRRRPRRPWAEKPMNRQCLAYDPAWKNAQLRPHSPFSLSIVIRS